MLFEWVPPKKSWMEEYEFILVQDMALLEDLIDKAISFPFCAFDLESTGLDTRVFDGESKSKVVGYSFSFEEKKGYYVPIRHEIETDRGHNLPIKEVNHLIQKLLNKATIVGHNWLKFDAEMMLASDGLTVDKKRIDNYHDTYILARLAGKKMAGLKYLSKTLLNKEMFDITDVVSSADKNISFSEISPLQGLIYAASDAICTHELFLHRDIQEPMLLQKLIYKLERSVSFVVRKMERNKVKLNVEHAKKLDKELSDKIYSIEQELFNDVKEKTHGQLREFTVDSPKDVSYILFDIFEMEPRPPKTSTGQYSTKDEELEKLAKKYTFAAKMQQYRTITKFHRTYIKNMILNVDKGGYLKFNFMQLKTDSGRFSSPGKDEGSSSKIQDGYSGVNIQAVPARYDESAPNVRACLSCEDDEVIIALDWSGVELRIAANMSKEPLWLDRFLKGDGDLHTATAAICLGKKEIDITKDERQDYGKTINFQSVYGGGPMALSQAIGCTVEEAKEKQKKFFGVLKTLRQYIKDLQKRAASVGYCETVFKRRRQLPGYASEDFGIRASEDRKAVNTPIQGTAADLMKFAMVGIDTYIVENNLGEDIQMLLTMHDELVFRLKRNKIHILEDIVEIMKLKNILQKIEWQVPLAVDAEVGLSWDVEFDYFKMRDFLKDKKGTDDVRALFQDYHTNISEYKQYLKDKKKEVKVETKKDHKDDIKSIVSSSVVETLVEKREPSEVVCADEIKNIEHKQPEIKIEEPTRVEREVESVEELEPPLTPEISDKKPSSLALSDLDLDAYAKLKKSFYLNEFKRIMKDEPSVEDTDLQIDVIVHNPIDLNKVKTINHILELSQGNCKVCLYDQKRELLKEAFVDIVKFAVLYKIYHI